MLTFTDYALENVPGLREYLKKNKKKQEAEEALKALEAPIAGSTYLQGGSVVPTSGTPSYAAAADTDIAPVALPNTSAFSGYFKKGALEDGWQFGDVARTVLGSATDFGKNFLQGVAGIAETTVDAFAGMAPIMMEQQLAAEGSRYSEGERKLYLEALEKAQEESDAFVTQDLLDEETAAKQLLALGFAAADPVKLIWGKGKFAAGVGDVLKDRYQQAMDYMSDDVVDGEIVAPSRMEQNSVFDQKGDALVQSGGQMTAQLLLNSAVPWWTVAGASAFGSEYEAALKEGASNEDAVLSGLITAGAEVLTEQLGGIKFPGAKAGLDEGLTKLISRTISDRFLRTAAKAGVDMAAEGAEEYITELIGQFGQWLSYKNEGELMEFLRSEEAVQARIDAIVGGALMGGAFAGINTVGAAAQGRDYASGMTNNEQAVVDRVYRDALAEAAANTKDGNLTEKQKARIYDSVLQQLERGDISTDTIREVLGGEGYKQYQKSEAEWKALEQEYDQLYNMKNGEKSSKQVAREEYLKEKLESQEAKTRREENAKKYTQGIQDLALKDRLGESYRQQGQRGVAFEADVSQYSGKAQETVQRAVEAGILNNTRKTHDFVDLIAKIADHTGQVFNFTDNQRLKESGFAIEGKQVNGYVSADGITLNINSPKALNRVAGHEVMHVLQEAGLADALTQKLFDYAESKGELASRREAVEAAYRGMDANINEELAAELVGDYLFTNEDFVRQLHREDLTVFEKVWDEIKRMAKMATTGSKEERELAKIEKMFADVYREARGAKNTAREDGVRYSMSGQNSQTADADALSRAMELQKQGVSNEAIRQETGWFVGMDGKWRYEIDDSQMTISDNISNYMRLGDLMQHDQLYAAYPDLADMDIVFQSLAPGVNASYDPQFDSINLSSRLKNDPFGIKDALAHELQHAIQQREGFASGASVAFWERRKQQGFDSRRKEDIRKARETEQELRRIQEEDPEFYRDMLELDAMMPDLPRGAVDWDTLEKIEDDPIEWQQYDARREALEEKYDDTKVWDMLDLLYEQEKAAKNVGRSAVELYYDTAGEIEARNVTNRQRLTPEQRKNSPPRLGNEDTVFAEVYREAKDAKNTAREDGVRYSVSNVESDNPNVAKVEGYSDYGIEKSIFRTGWLDSNPKLLEAIVDNRGQTKTEKFAAWFGDSQAINKSGDPLLVYHGTNSRFVKFESDGKPIWFSPNVMYSRGGASVASTGDKILPSGKVFGGASERVIPAYIKAENPADFGNTSLRFDDIVSDISQKLNISEEDLRKVWENTGRNAELYKTVHSAEMVELLKQNGYDSIKAVEDGVPTWAVFESNQAKSAVANNGSFNINNPDIRYAISDKTTDFAPMAGDVYGRDIGIEAPVREDLDADNVPEAGTDALEAFEAMLDEIEVETTRDRLVTMRRNSQAELDANKRLRQEAREKYDQKIADTQAKYDSKKNKETKLAQGYLKRIEKLKRLQADVDAGYAKRIHDIEKRLEKTDSELEKDHTRRDGYQKALAQIDRYLEQDKAALDEEYRMKREAFQDKNQWLSNRAMEIYQELRHLKKGKKASAELSYLLDLRKENNWEYDDLRSAFVNVRYAPDHVVNQQSPVEQAVREVLDGAFESEMDAVDLEYDEQVAKLEAEAEEKRQAARTSNQAKTKHEQHQEEVKNLIGDTTFWRDKPLGIQYATNTEYRNLLDVVRGPDGKPDYARAKAIHDYLGGSYNHNEAQFKKKLGEIQQWYQEQNITKEESVYIQMLGEMLYNPDTELSMDVVEEYLQEHKEKIDVEKVYEVIEQARADYDVMFEWLNGTLREAGMKEIDYRKGYFPHLKVEAESGWLGKLLNWKKPNNEIPTSIAGMTEEFNPQRSYQSFNKRRTGDTTEYDFLKGFDAYMHGALDWIYHIEDIQRRREFENYIRYIHSDEGIKAQIDAVYQDPYLNADEVQAEVDRILGEAANPLGNFVTDMRTRTNTLAAKKHSLDRGMEQLVNRDVYSVASNISGRVSANMGAGSLSAAMSNVIPNTQSWGEVSPLYTLRALGDIIKGTVHGDDAMVEKSDFLTNRLVEEEKLSQDFWDKAGDKIGWLMGAVDSVVSKTVWDSKYRQNLSQGMSENAAIRDADQFAENLMAGRSRGNQPTLFESKNLVTKMFTAFQLEVNNQYHYLFKDLPRAMQNEAKGKLVWAYAKIFAGAYLYNALSTAVTGREQAFDPIRILQRLLEGVGDEEEDDSEDIEAFVDDILENTPFIGGWVGGGRVPISSALPYDGNFKDAVSGVAKAWESKDWKDVLKELENPMYYLLPPMAGGQLRKTVQGLGMFIGDKPTAGSYADDGALRYTVDANFGNVFQAALFGQWANKNAQQYIEEGRKPLSEKQTEEFLALDIPITQYWEIRDGLKELKTLNEKADYIASLDLSTKQKNILINNIADRKDRIDLEDYDQYADFAEMDFAVKKPELYSFLQQQGVTVKAYEHYTATTKAAYSWAAQNPEKYTLSRAVTDNLVQYRRYTQTINGIEADKDAGGKVISGSRKDKVVEYINKLDLDYGARIILYRMTYTSDDTYNYEIVEYLNSRKDISYQEMVTILEELDMEVDKDGNVTW